MALTLREVCGLTTDRPLYFTKEYELTYSDDSEAREPQSVDQFLSKLGRVDRNW